MPVSKQKVWSSPSTFRTSIRMSRSTYCTRMTIAELKSDGAPGFLLSDDCAIRRVAAGSDILELRKLDIAIGQTSVAKYMAKRRGPPSPGVEDVPPQSCRRHRRDRSVRRSRHLVPSALWFVDHRAWPTTGPMVRSNDASDRGMDHKPAHGSLRMGAASPLSDPRSRCSLW
jgi:hypothetical protein